MLVRDDALESGTSEVTRSELLAVGALIVLCDVTVYRSHGFAGLAVLFALAPWWLLLGVWTRSPYARPWVSLGLLTVLAARLVWDGSVLAAGAGFALLIAFSMALWRVRPGAITIMSYGIELFPGGLGRLEMYARHVTWPRPRRSGSEWLSVLFPLAALVVFGLIFLFANPDLLDAI
jgi:hypothetical protein